MDDERTPRGDETYENETPGSGGAAGNRAMAGGTAGDSGVVDTTPADPVATDPTAADVDEEGGLISSTDLSGGGGDFGTAGTGSDGTPGDAGRDTHGR